MQQKYNYFGHCAAEVPLSEVESKLNVVKTFGQDLVDNKLIMMITIKL